MSARFNRHGEDWLAIPGQFLRRPVYSFNTYVTPRWVFVLARKVRNWR